MKNTPARGIDLDAARLLLCTFAPERLEAFDFARKIFRTPLNSSALELESIPEAHDLSADDIALLQEGTVIHPQPMKEIYIGSPLYVRCVPETTKGRKRMIQWTKAINDVYLIDETPLANMDLATPAQAIENFRNSLKHDLCPIVCDGKAFFHQFKLEGGGVNHHLFKFNGHVFSASTIPTGMRHSAPFTHTVIAAVGAMIRCRAGEKFGPREEPYIDGCRIFVPKNEVLNATKILFKECAKINLALNESPKEVYATAMATTHEWCGVTYRKDRAEVALADNFITKLRLKKKWIEGNPALTLREFMSLFSSLRYGSEILGLPLAGKYHIYKFLRKRSSAATHDKRLLAADARVWPCIREPLSKWFEEVLTAPPRKIHQRRRSIIVYTDASLSGLGVIYEVDGKVTCLGCPWPESLLECAPAIEELEALALLAAIRHIGENVGGGPFSLLIYVDNTTVLSSTRRGYARAYWTNQAIGAILHAMKSYALEIGSLNYIESQKNPADWWSRLYRCQLPVESAGLVGPQ